MRKNYFFFKSLLLATVLMLGSANAWGAETVLNPTGGVTTVATNSSTVAYNSEATTWEINQGSLTGGNIGKTAGPYCLVKFDASDIPGTITGATISFDITANAYNSSLNVWKLGAADWDATTVIWSALSSSAKSATTVGSGAWSTKNKTVNIAYTITDYVTNSLMGFAIATNTARQQTISNIKLTITYTTATTYTATFTETNSLNPTVTIYTDAGRTEEINNGALLDKTTYYYRAVLDGYNDYDGSFTVNGANPSESFTMTMKSRYTFKVNLVNNDGGAVIQTLYTDEDSYDGKIQNMSYPLYLTDVGNSVTYVSTDGSYYKSFTSSSADATKNIPYTALNKVAYYFEGEDVSGATTYTTGTFGPRSSNGATGVLSAATVTSLEAGVYRITARSIGKAANKHSIYKNSVEDENKILEVTTTTWGAVGSAIITLDDNTDIVANGGYYTTTDNGHGFDYILIEKLCPVEIGTAGFATLYTPFALDFTGTGLEAYTATIAGSTVTLNPVTNVQAGTGVVLKGAAGTYNVPVILSSSTDKGSMLGSLTSATPFDAYYTYKPAFYIYGLAVVPETDYVQFTLVTSGEIPAGKAYLAVAETSAKSLRVVVDGQASEVTAPEVVETEEPEVLYNMAGIPVGKDFKGYVINQKGEKRLQR